MEVPLARISMKQAAVAALAGAVLLGVAAFGLYQILPSSNGGPQGRLTPAEPALPLQQAADPAIVFPPALQGLDVIPTHFALDRTSGVLWLAGYATEGGPHLLFRFDPATGSLDSFPYFEGPGTPIVSSITVDGRGHVLIAQVSTVLDLDPNGILREHDLGVTSYPAISEYATPFPLGAMFLDSDGSVFASRVDAAAITRLNPATGEIREFPFPPTFGSALELAVAEGVIWITNPFSNVNGLRASTAVIDTTTGEFQAFPGLLTGFADRALDGRLYAVNPDAGIIVASIDDLPEQTIELGPARADEPGMGLGYEDHLIVDAERRVLWVASGGRTDISRIDLENRATKTYNLPVYLSRPFSCPFGADCTEPVEVRLTVSFMAVAENGDLWFAEEGGRRIGVIPASAQ